MIGRLHAWGWGGARSHCCFVLSFILAFVAHVHTTIIPCLLTSSLESRRLCTTAHSLHTRFANIFGTATLKRHFDRTPGWAGQPRPPQPPSVWCALMTGQAEASRGEPSRGQWSHSHPARYNYLVWKRYGSTVQDTFFIPNIPSGVLFCGPVLYGSTVGRWYFQRNV